ncbi:hypothetical protein GCM10023205_27820 [Yinghuangia aomiensis]|uniref:Uncharacterized protein n=1 Tax=Yinghuangia aomiensis TaxID=676205 RepID=A0ABP9H6T7_9ACTN
MPWAMWWKTPDNRILTALVRDSLANLSEHLDTTRFEYDLRAQLGRQAQAEFPMGLICEE